MPGGLLLAELHLRIVALAQHLAQLKLLPARAGSSASAELLLGSGAQEWGGARSLHHLDRGLVAVRAGVVSRPPLRRAAADFEPSARHSTATVIRFQQQCCGFSEEEEEEVESQKTLTVLAEEMLLYSVH